MAEFLTIEYLAQNQWILMALVLWILPWKGWALWRSARNSHKIWFIILLVVNTMALLEIFYIFFLSGKNMIKKNKNGEKNN